MFLQPVRDVQWLGRAAVITAGASGEICVYSASGLGELKLTGMPCVRLESFMFSVAANVKDLHDDALREIAVNQLEPNRCASGGECALSLFEIASCAFFIRSRPQVVRA